MTIGVTPTQCGNAPSAASSTSWTLTTTAAIDAGEVGVLRIAFDNISAADGDNDEISSITGGTGTWEKLAEYTNSQGGQALGVTVAAWLFTPSASNAVGTVFTITLDSARTQKIAALEKYTIGTGSSLRQTTEAAVVTTQVDAGAGFGSAAYTGLTSLERLYLRVLGAEMSTVSSVSPTSGFTALSSFRSSTSSPISLLGEYRVNTSTGETSNPSFTPTADKAGIFLALEEYSLGGGTIIGTSTATLDSLSATVSANSAIASAATGTFDSLTASGVATSVTGANAAGTLGNITAIGTATSAIGVNAAGTLGGFTANGVATSVIGVTAAGTLGGFMVVATCQVVAVPTINAEASATLGSLTAAISAASISLASSAATLGSLTAAGVAVSVTTAESDATLGSFVVNAIASSVALPPVDLTASATFDSLTAIGQVSTIVEAEAAATLNSFTVLAIGQVGGFTPIQPVRYLKFVAPLKVVDFTTIAKALHFVAPAKVLYFNIGIGQMQTMPIKYSEEIWLVSLDLTPWIAAGNTVASFDIIEVNGSAVCDQPQILSGNTGRWRISGGRAGSATVFRAVATMSDGQAFAQEFKLPVA